VNWFQQNRFLGSFLAALALGILAALIFIWMAKSSFDETKTNFEQQAVELATLQRHNPFPNEANLRKLKTHTEEYAAALESLKTDLKSRVLPVAAMAPNEFQSRLNQTRAALVEKARANKVKLPDNFFLGFEEFAAALPDTAAAPLLGQELAQVEMLLNLLIDARVDAITSFRRVPLAERSSPIATPMPAASTTFIERNVVEFAFAASPGSARRMLNQIATAPQQFYIVRTLHLLNQQEKGPSRVAVPGGANIPAAAASLTPAKAALNFIVGNEHIQATARVEMLRFTF
jgi:hypothetical protein